MRAWAQTKIGVSADSKTSRPIHFVHTDCEYRLQAVASSFGVIEFMARELSPKYVGLRRSHATWLLLASRNGPLILASLRPLLDTHPGGVPFEDAVEYLAEVFAEYANDAEFEVGEDRSLAARKELRQWFKRGLIVERNDQLLATDALQRAFLFLDSIEAQAMTSTASRLATVQRAIETLDEQLSPNQASRIASLESRIGALQDELVAVRAGVFEVLDGLPAEEGIREVYQLAISLQADFRRVEDSYRDADRSLRQRIISDKHNRGQIVDELLESHHELLKTAEGQVFEAFHQQLVKPVELEQMKSRIRSILGNKNTDRALQRKQKANLLQLVSRLVQDSEPVIQARARGERDVRNFLRSGLAREQVRVGALLQDILYAALEVDWKSQKVRRSTSPLPPIAVAISNLPVIERLLVKQINSTEAPDLDLTVAESDPTKMDAEFWHAFNALDRVQLFQMTIAHLHAAGKPLTISELAKALPPTHDLETLVYWLAMARQAGIEILHGEETIDLFDVTDGWTRFRVPSVQLLPVSISSLDLRSLE
ncbi:MAG: hypothetical protein JWN70_6931 [Planctomycetaceae bacterium]|nr:hypothetical protein [Planctomycetaceae bacterium]